MSGDWKRVFPAIQTANLDMFTDADLDEQVHLIGCSPSDQDANASAPSTTSPQKSGVLRRIKERVFGKALRGPPQTVHTVHVVRNRVHSKVPRAPTAPMEQEENPSMLDVMFCQSGGCDVDACGSIKACPDAGGDGEDENESDSDAKQKEVSPADPVFDTLSSHASARASHPRVLSTNPDVVVLSLKHMIMEHAAAGTPRTLACAQHCLNYINIELKQQQAAKSLRAIKTHLGYAEDVESGHKVAEGDGAGVESAPANGAPTSGVPPKERPTIQAILARRGRMEQAVSNLFKRKTVTLKMKNGTKKVVPTRDLMSMGFAALRSHGITRSSLQGCKHTRRVIRAFNLTPTQWNALG